MGFHNPPSSATALDTRGRPSGGGVSVFTVPDPIHGFDYGVVQFSDGVAGDAAAQVLAQATPNPRGLATLGGSLMLKSGSYAGATGPELDLSVEGDGAGFFGPVTRLSVGPLLVAGRRIDAVGWVVHYMGDVNYTWPPPASWGVLPGAGPYAVRDLLAGEQLEVEFSAALGAALNPGSGLQLRVLFTTAAATTAGDAGYWSNSTASSFAVPTRLNATLDGPATSVTYQVQAQRVGNQPQNIQAGGLAAPYLRHRIVPS